ncbi:glycoside hydrolase family 66 protein [Paenibacillus sp.]|uniref:glycoside hydrolase family 66 protein n=1 Tax=Paenibacillus sp. TaxID=58172 RepID=UPI0028110BF3|nr:glycoside hydrolase family 66 protein [Paenibacillus sp.]
MVRGIGSASPAFGTKTLMLMFTFTLMTTLMLTLTSCRNEAAPTPDDVSGPPGEYIAALSTDRARYEPGRPVAFRAELARTVADGELVVRLSHLGDAVDRLVVDVTNDDVVTWTWTPPERDYTGYMAEVYVREKGKLLDHATIAVDVSSHWSKFPRYGYLADFPRMTAEARKDVVDRLNRLHLNGLQFYDWQWKHHRPLKTDGAGGVAATWPDIANREVSFDTVRGYIDLAHERGMKAMNYNLLFGAYADAERDGAKEAWRLYRDPLATTPDRHELPDAWASDLYIMDPSNPKWLAYLFEEERKAFEALPFDGWHVDQLGDRGTLYTADGEKRNLMLAYGDMLREAKDALGVELVMNAVSQFGQRLIAKAPVEFLYTEVWGSHPEYKHLKAIIDENASLSENRLPTVLAAYVNYDLADGAGAFNLPGVLLLDAVIFASGGAHLEAGESLLAKEYFPNRNLSVSAELEARLTAYYDFLVAYQNVLRDGAEELEDAGVTSSAARVSAEPEAGAVWALAKRQGDADIVHFVNFASATSTAWNDADGTMPAPRPMEGVPATMTAAGNVARVWTASPDRHGGAPASVDFVQEGDRVTFSLPRLEYWTMAVVEYGKR